MILGFVLSLAAGFLIGWGVHDLWHRLEDDDA